MTIYKVVLNTPGPQTKNSRSAPGLTRPITILTYSSSVVPMETPSCAEFRARDFAYLRYGIAISDTVSERLETQMGREFPWFFHTVIPVPDEAANV